MKKIISFIISITIVLSSLFSLGINAYANTVASGDCGTSGNSVKWSLSSDGILTISGANQRMADYYSLGGNNAPWFSYKDDIKAIKIENGVINIGAYAFYDLNNLKTVDFGTIDTIGNNAFESCDSLEKAILPNSCTWIWANAFNACTSLKIAFVNAVNSYQNSIPVGMFNGCTSLRLLELGDSINNVEADALTNTNNLTIVSNSSGIKSYANANNIRIANKTGVVSNNTYSTQKLNYSWDSNSCTLSFYGSGDMTYYENDVKPWYPFYLVAQKVDFSATDAKTSISTNAFADFVSLKTVNFKNIYSVGWQAFANCNNLQNVKFDKAIERIWGYAFTNDTSIDRVEFDELDNELIIDVGAFKNCTGTTYWFNSPKKCKSIGDEAFFGTNFNYVTIYGENVSLGKDAFGNGTGSYSRFFGVGGMDTGVYSWVKDNRNNNGYNWHYYCYGDNHKYSTQTIEPNCTDRGYDIYLCPYCDADKFIDNYVSELGHSFRLYSGDESRYLYRCRRCDESDIQLSAVDVLNYFKTTVSTDADKLKYRQKNYNGAADVNNDGVVNARDYAIIINSILHPNLTNRKTNIDLGTTYQTIDGFGASAAWWSQSVGAWDNADEILGLLYDKKDGIGLNIYRYNLGAGSRDINDTTMYIDDERTNCFLQANGTYNWNNDAIAMNSLALAKKHNSDLKLTLFANSPPVYMTDNGRAYVDIGANKNLSTNKYQAYADYMIKCAEHFIDLGYNVSEISPINEPEWGWTGWQLGDGSISCGQEGCHWTYSDACNFYNNYMIPALQNSQKCNLTVGLSVWESAQMRHSDFWSNYLNTFFSTASKYSKNNANIRSYVDSVDIHSYWGDASARIGTKNDIDNLKNGKKIRCSEYCQMYNDYNTGVVAHINAEGGSTKGLSIDYGIAMADIIYQDMTILNAVEWDWWTAVGKGVYTDSLIYADNNTHNYETSKRLYCLGNYSKFIQAGAKRVAVSTESNFAKNLYTSERNIYIWNDPYGNEVIDKNNYLEQSAYLNPDGSVVVVYVNNSDTAESTTFDENVFSSFSSYVTSAKLNLEQYQTGRAGNAVSIPPRSVTTVVLKR